MKARIQALGVRLADAIDDLNTELTCINLGADEGNPGEVRAAVRRSEAITARLVTIAEQLQMGTEVDR